MKSWGFPWFPFVLELFRQSAAKSPSPLTKEGYGGSRWPGSMARVSQPQVAAMATITGVERGAIRRPGTGYRDGLDYSSSLKPRRGGRS